MGTTGTQLPPEQKVFGGHHADGRLLIKRPGMRLEYELWRFPTQSPQAFQVPQTAQTRMKASIDNYANVRATRDTGAWVFAHKVANVRSGGSEWRLLSGGYVSCGSRVCENADNFGSVEHLSSA